MDLRNKPGGNKNGPCFTLDLEGDEEDVLPIEFANYRSPFKPTQLLESETGKRRDLFPAVREFLPAQTPPTHSSLPPIVAISRRRARASRDITVPIGASVARAISR
jgi:hypothetical protein